VGAEEGTAEAHKLRWDAAGGGGTVKVAMAQTPDEVRLLGRIKETSKNHVCTTDLVPCLSGIVFACDTMLMLVRVPPRRCHVSLRRLS
jgi:hypothetical protein